MEHPRKILSFIAPAIPLNPMIRITGQKLIFPVYHAANDECPAHLKHLYKIRTVAEFENDLEELCRYFEPLSPAILRAPGKLRKRKKPGFILSFDDGLREIKDTVEPVLTRKGIPAIFFVNNAFIDNRAMFFRYKASVLCEIILKSEKRSLPEAEIARVLDLQEFEKNSVVSAILGIRYLQKSKLDALADLAGFNITRYLSEVRPYLNSEEIIGLQSKGFHIGAHSYDHPRFTDLNEEQMKFEVTASLEDVEQRFSPEMKFFAFPFTDAGISERVIDKVFQENPQAIFGTAGIKKEKHAFHFQRIPFEKYRGSVINHLKTEYFYYILKAPFGKNISKR